MDIRTFLAALVVAAGIVVGSMAYAVVSTAVDIQTANLQEIDALMSPSR